MALLTGLFPDSTHEPYEDTHLPEDGPHDAPLEVGRVASPPVNALSEEYTYYEPLPEFSYEYGSPVRNRILLPIHIHLLISHLSKPLGNASNLPSASASSSTSPTSSSNSSPSAIPYT